MRTNRSLFCLAAALLAGCVADTSSLEQRDDVEGGGGEECKIEGSDIGRVGATVTVHGTTVTFLSWTPKADSPGEYVGFTLSDEAASLSYVVKAGGTYYPDDGTAWSHPDGDSGPDVNAISNVDFCDDEPCHDAGVGVPVP